MAKIYICDDKLKPFFTMDVPFETFRRGRAKWAKVKIRPTPVPETFFVLTNFLATATRGVYLGIDDKAPGQSFTALPHGKLKPFGKGNWMIRISGSDKVKGDPYPVLDEESEMELAYDDGEMENRQSIGMSGHAVEFSAPSGEWYLSHVSLHGSQYGANFNPAHTYFNVFICDRKLKVLSRSAHPYSVFPRSNQAQWVSLDVEPIRVKGKFYVLVSFNPTSTRGIYLSIDESVKKSHSLTAMPKKTGGKLGSKKEWMIRASLMKKADSVGEAEDDVSGDKEPDNDEAEDEGPDAMQFAEWKEELEKLEADEDLTGLKAKLSEIGNTSKETVDSFGKIHVTDQVWVRYVNVPSSYAKAIAEIYECCYRVLRDDFRFEDSFCVVPGKRLHVHLLADKSRKLQLYTVPGSKDYPLVVNTMPTWKRGFSPPSKGGPHIVYGLCHELGHVLIGWTDSRHQWAHYVGSKLVDRITEELGRSLWPQPYHYLSEGMFRYMSKIEDQLPDRETDAGTARIFYEVEKNFGLDIWGKTIPWICENQPGDSITAYKRYSLDDLKAALVEAGCDERLVSKCFGDS